MEVTKENPSIFQISIHKNYKPEWGRFNYEKN